MEVKDLIMFFLLANQFFGPITIIGNQYNQALVAMAGAERVFRVIDTEPDWTEPADVREFPDPRKDGTTKAKIGCPALNSGMFPLATTRTTWCSMA